MAVGKCDLLVILKVEIRLKMEFEFIIFMLIFTDCSYYIRWAGSVILKSKQNRNYKKLTLFYDCVKNVYSETETNVMDGI